MNMDWNARCGIFPASGGGSRLRRLAWRRPRKGDGGNCNRDGHVRPTSPSLCSARLCFAGHWPSGYRRVRRRIDVGARVGSIPFLADGSCGTPYPADDGARQSRLGFGDAPSRLYDHASRMVVARTAVVDPCHMVSSASIARERQRSILENFPAADVRDGIEGITDFRRRLDEGRILSILLRTDETGCYVAVDGNGRFDGVARHGPAQAIPR